MLSVFRPARNSAENRITVSVDPLEMDYGVARLCGFGQSVSLDIDSTNTSADLPGTDPDYNSNQNLRSYSHTLQSDG